MNSAKDPIIIDVREPDEFKQGHVPGAINIPLASIAQAKQLANIPKHTPLIVYCRSGARASSAIDILHNMGFTSLTNGVNSATTLAVLQREL